MSKTFRAGATFAVGLMGVLGPLSAARAEPADPVTREIARLEEEYSQSFVSGDTRIAQRLVTDDFVGLEPNGKISDKTAILADVTSEPRPTSLKIAALTVRRLGDTAIALGTEEDTYPGTTTIARRRWLDTWRKTPAGWRLAASAEITVQP